MLHIFCGLFLSTLFLCSGQVINCNEDEYEKLTNEYDLTLVQYSAEWCHFSQELKPIFEEVAKNLSELKTKKTVALLRIDCDEHANLCAKQGIRKYPTIRMTRFGRSSKREYRGPRTIEALVSFVHDNLKDTITLIDLQNQSMQEAFKLTKNNEATIVALFPTVDDANPHLIHFKKSAILERENCRFYLVYNVNETGDRLAFSDIMSDRPKEVTLLKSADFPAIYNWINSRCTPVVRELTFQNAEEITDEARPLLILFYGQNSDHLKKRFVEIVRNELAPERAAINFLMADGYQFTHPLMHLRKTVNDLPVLCIDSLVHMFSFPKPVNEAFSDPTLLRQFIADLHSGKLHREFHYGPDPTPSQPSHQQDSNRIHVSDPPQSVFRQLTPSKRRYTILHDEF